jgi:hypothetical protein
MIPKTFKLFNTTWTVKQVNKIDKQGSMGLCDYGLATISLRKNLKKDIKEATFHHELIHAILDTLNYDKLSRDEKFVDTFGQALHQALKTFDYGK